MASSQDPADWSYAYGFIDEQWRDFRSIFREINSEQARADLKEIEAGMNALRESLNLTGSFNRPDVADLAAQHRDQRDQHQAGRRSLAPREPPELLANRPGRSRRL